MKERALCVVLSGLSLRVCVIVSLLGCRGPGLISVKNLTVGNLVKFFWHPSSCTVIHLLCLVCIRETWADVWLLFSPTIFRLFVDNNFKFIMHFYFQLARPHTDGFSLRPVLFLGICVGQQDIRTLQCNGKIR